MHGRERRHAGRVVMARPSTSARSTAPGPSRSISRSVAMLSLAEIICCAAVRTDTVRAGRQFVEAGRSDRLALLGDGQLVVPAHRAGLDRFRNRKQHIEFEDRRERQRQVGVGARDLRRTCRPSDLRDLIRVPRARLGQLGVDVRPRLDHRRLAATPRTGRPGRRRWCAVRCPAPRRRTSARAGSRCPRRCRYR